MIRQSASRARNSVGTIRKCRIHTTTASHTYRHTMSVPSTTSSPRHIVLVGGGIIGTTSAYYLSQHSSFTPARGDTITILEACSIASGASGKAGGLLALWAYPSCIVPLSFALHKELAETHDGAKLWGYRSVGCGQVDAVAPERPLKRSDETAPKQGGAVSLQKRSPEMLKRLQKVGVPDDLDWLDDEAVRGYEAMAAPGETAQVHPAQFTRAIADLAQDAGVRIVIGRATSIAYVADGQSVSGVSYTSPSSSSMEEHSLPATDIVLTAGPWTSTLYPSIPVSGLRAHSAVIRTTPQVSPYALFTSIALPRTGPRRPTIVTPEMYARPDGTVYACGEGDGSVALPDTADDVQVDEARVQDVIDHVGSISRPLREGELVARQACYLPNVDRRSAKGGGGPIVGASGKVKGLYLATGHTCWGIQNSAGTGKLISEMVWEGETKSADISDLDPKLWGL